MKIVSGELYKVTNEDLDENLAFIVPNNVTTIKTGAFVNAKKMKHLFIGEGVSLIETGAFLGAKNVIEVNVPLHVPSLNIDKCDFPNLKVIDIDLKINNVDYAMNKIINEHNILLIKVIDGEKFYIVKKTENFDIDKVDKDTLTFKANNFDNCVIITKNGMKKCKKSDLIPYIKNQNVETFIRNNSKVFKGNLTLIYKWIECIKNSKKISYFPEETVMISIPATKKAVTEYMMKKKLWEKVEEEFPYKYMTNYRSGFMKLCYAMGLFSGNEIESREAQEFLQKFKKKSDKCYEIIDTFYHTDLNVNGYIPEFANFFIKEMQNLQRSGIFEYADMGREIYNNLPKLVTYFKNNNIKFTSKHVLEFVKEKTFKTRKGNEELYKKIKKYSSEYDTNSYELMQDLYEKAKIVSRINSKTIVNKKDKKNEYYYKWLEGYDPVNFVLGDKVGCCARVNDVGDGILRGSVTNENLRNLAFYRKGNKLIGKATAYYNKDKKYVLLNNAKISASVSVYDKERSLKALKRRVKDKVNESIKNNNEILNI